MRGLRATLARARHASSSVVAPSDGRRSAPEDRELRTGYASFAVRPIDYATVCDFSDSLRRLSPLATTQGDLKDVQRPWMVKALWSLLPQGARIVEVGGGQPYVADALSRSGFDVTIVDPYDGSANGPREYARYRDAYPHVTFVPTKFDEDIGQFFAAESYDAVFSISVLEHLTPAEIGSVMRGARDLLREGGWSIHNVDHVMHGRDEAQSLERLGILARLHGVADEDLRTTLLRADLDTDTYFLSAESHERWRAYLGLTYEEYPMQRVVSVSVAAERGHLVANGARGGTRTSGSRAGLPD